MNKGTGNRHMSPSCSSCPSCPSCRSSFGKRLPRLAFALALFASSAAAARAQAPLAIAAADARVVAAPMPALPASELRAKLGDGWRVWWRSADAPVRWSAADAPLARTARWTRAADGVEWAEVALGGSGEAWRTRVIVARLDPARVALRLDTAFTAGVSRRRPAWTVERAAERDASSFAVNAGQFLYSAPWGWVVLDGREWLAAGTGPLASAFIVDAEGRARLVHGDAVARLEAANEARREVAWAFQSYPTLLAGGEVPAPLRTPGRGVDLGHRDARLAVGTTADGKVLVALTRFDALGGRLAFVPFGLTVPETAALMGALGATDAVMLDGGISAQMHIRDAKGRSHSWEGLRAVPLALVAIPRKSEQ